MDTLSSPPRALAPASALHDSDPDAQVSPYARHLLGLIHAVLSGALAEGAFCAAYGDYFIEHAPDPLLSVAQADLFAAIQHKIDWTDAAPSPRARRHGWRDHGEFLGWLRQQIER